MIIQTTFEVVRRQRGHVAPVTFLNAGQEGPITVMFATLTGLFLLKYFF